MEPVASARGRAVVDTVPHLFHKYISLFTPYSVCFNTIIICSIPCLQLGIPPISNKSQLRTNIGKIIIMSYLGESQEIMTNN
jgi:hypothetical protein